MSSIPRFPHHVRHHDSRAKDADGDDDNDTRSTHFPDARSAYEARGEVVLPQHHEEVPVDPTSVDSEWITGHSAAPLGGDGFLQWASRNDRPRRNEAVNPASTHHSDDPPTQRMMRGPDLSPMKLTTHSTANSVTGASAASPLAQQSRAVDHLLFSAPLVQGSEEDTGAISARTADTTAAAVRRSTLPLVSDIFAYTRLDAEVPTKPLPSPLQQQRQLQDATPTKHQQQQQQHLQHPPASGSTHRAGHRQRFDATDDVFRSAPDDTPGFNDPRLVARLQHLIQDRLMLEQYLLLQDEAQEMEDMILRESVARRELVFQSAFAYHRCATEQRQRAALDALMVQYAATDYVPQTRAALMQRIEIAQTELDEINEAIAAVKERTEAESMDAEDRLVEVLTNIRTERSILMEQLQHAEERRAKLFETQKDPFIEQNFSDVQVSRSGSSSVGGGGGAFRGSPLGGGDGNQRRRGSAGDGDGRADEAMVGGHHATAAVFSRDRAIPKDLWVAKTLPAARRVFAHLQEQSPTAAATAHRNHHNHLAPLHDSPPFAAARRHIDALFPMPPLRGDLEAIQRAEVPRPSASILAAASSVGDRVVPPPAAKPSSCASANRQGAAAYYQSFLAAAASPSQATGGPTVTRQPPPQPDGSSYKAAASAAAAGAVTSSDDVIRALSQNVLDAAAVLPRHNAAS